MRDISGFLMGIAQVFADRLAASPYAHYSDAFTLAMHSRDEAYRLTFDDGILTDVSPLKHAYGDLRNLVEILFPQAQSHVLSVN